MRPLTIVLIAVSVIVLLVAGFCGMYLYSMSKVSVSSVAVHSLGEISLDGFLLGGTVELTNGGVLPVYVTDVNYTVVLERTGEELASGSVAGDWISAKEVKQFDASVYISWVPTADLALTLLDGEAYIVVSGTADLRFGTLDFEERVDISPYVEQFVVEKVEVFLDEFLTAVEAFFG